MANPWEMDWSGQQAGLEAVPLPPKMPAQTPTQRALDDVNLQLKQKQLSQAGQVGALKPTEFQSKSAGFLGRLARANAAWESLPDSNRGPRGVVRQWFHDSHPDLENTLINSDGRQTADQNALDFVRASLRQESGAAINKDEEVKQYKIFFPMPGDGPEVLAQKALARKQAIEGFRIAAGPLAESAMANLQLGQESPPAEAPTAAPEMPPALNLDQRGNVILKDEGQTLGGSDTGFLGLSGGVHSEADPKMAGANEDMNRLLKRGASDKTIIGYLKQRGADDAFILPILQKAAKIREFQKENPNYRGDFHVDIERVQVPNSAWENFANSDVGVGLASAGDAATAFNTDSLVGLAGGDPEQTRQALAVAQAAHPKSAAAGTIAGGVGSALSLEGLASKAGLSGLGRSVTADLGYGAAAGAGATDYADDGSQSSIGDRLSGAGKGAVAATAGGLVGSGIAGVGRNVARGAKDPYVAQINAAEIPTTVGQQYTGKLGGIVKRTEDRIAGLPVIGDIINARRIEGVTKFNEKIFDKALEPIGEKVQGRVGEAGIDYAQEKISDAFNKALKGKAVNADRHLANDLTKAVIKAKGLPRVGDEVADNIRVILEPYMKGGQLSGEAMQQISRELRDLKASYNSDPLKKRIGDSINDVEEAIFGPFRRQAPDVLPAYNKAKLAQRRLYIVADAVNAAKNKEGIFMPSQLGNADRAATKKLEGKVSAARGRGQFHDEQRAAQQVLPSSIPDSGTAGRILIPAVALGAGGASDASGTTDGAGTTLAAILALAYSRGGQRLLTKPGRGMKGKMGKALQSDRTQKLLTAAGASTGVGLANQQ